MAAATGQPVGGPGKGGVNIGNFADSVKRHAGRPPAVVRFYDGCAAGRSLAGPSAATPIQVLFQTFLCCSTHLAYASMNFCRNGLTVSDNLPDSSKAVPAPPRYASGCCINGTSRNTMDWRK